MTLFYKAAALAMISAILGLAVGKQGKDWSLLISIAACTMITAITVTYLEPVFTFIHRLEILGNLKSEMLKILTQVLGIGLIAEVASMVCTDAGNATLAKAIQLLGSAAILCLSVPLFTSLIDMIEEILGAI